MGYTTRISDYEMDRAWTRGPEVGGVEVDKPEVRAKKVEPEKKAAPKKSSARTTTKDIKS